MRLVAWNCAEKFSMNYLRLQNLNFDVAIVTECAPLPSGHEEVRELSAIVRQPVGPLNGRKHLGVFARSPWTLTPIDIGDDHPWCIAAKVDGPVPFTIMGVWAQDPSTLPGRPAYTKQLSLLIDEVLPQLSGDVVLAGDFNAPGYDTTSIKRHQANVDALITLDLVSAEDATRGGRARVPTYFHWRHADKPFHIDHVFVPRPWAEGLTVAVGSHEDWVATGFSDHTPIVIERHWNFASSGTLEA